MNAVAQFGTDHQNPRRDAVRRRNEDDQWIVQMCLHGGCQPQQPESASPESMSCRAMSPRPTNFKCSATPVSRSAPIFSASSSGSATLLPGPGVLTRMPGRLACAAAAALVMDASTTMVNPKDPAHHPHSVGWADRSVSESAHRRRPPSPAARSPTRRPALPANGPSVVIRRGRERPAARACGAAFQSRPV